MKGLDKIPSTDELSLAYGKLQSRQPSLISLAEIILWSQWSRFDPRLAEQLIVFISEKWKRWNPVFLHEELLKQPWPQAFGVLLEQALAAGFLSKESASLFKKWGDVVLSDISPANGEQFFIGLQKLGSKQMLRNAERPLRAYTAWGYFGCDLLVNKAQEKIKLRNRTLVSAAVRKHVLSELLKTRKRLTVKDYCEALSYQVSRRQAEIDLAREKRLIPSGQTRGRFYRVR